MSPEYPWMWWHWSGMWVFPLVMIAIMLIFFFLFFGRGRSGPPWCNHFGNSHENEDSESALELLKKRYAKGEINKEEFDQIKKDISS